MFRRDTQGCLYYESTSGIEYSLLEGKTDNGKTSDIVFIFREATEEDHDKGFYGEVVNWKYGGFQDLKFLEEDIIDYEIKRGIRNERNK